MRGFQCFDFYIFFYDLQRISHIGGKAIDIGRSFNLHQIRLPALFQNAQPAIKRVRIERFYPKESIFANLSKSGVFLK